MKGDIFKHSYHWNCSSHFGGRIKECFLPAFCFNSLGYYFWTKKEWNFLQKIFLIVVPKIGEFWVLSQFCYTYSTFLFWLSWGTMRLFCELRGYWLFLYLFGHERLVGWLDDYYGIGCLYIFWLFGQCCKCFQKRADYPKFTLIYKVIKSQKCSEINFGVLSICDKGWS